MSAERRLAVALAFCGACSLVMGTLGLVAASADIDVAEGALLSEGVIRAGLFVLSVGTLLGSAALAFAVVALLCLSTEVEATR